MGWQFSQQQQQQTRESGEEREQRKKGLVYGPADVPDYLADLLVNHLLDWFYTHTTEGKENNSKAAEVITIE